MNRLWLSILGILVLATIAVWAAILTRADDNLHLVACDVGEGDAILATWKSYQILVDGGPDNSVLSCLGKYMPFWDREIEVVVNTHPQQDHYGGLVEVVRRYKADVFVENGFDSGSEGWRVLEKEVGGRGVRVVKARTGTTISTGLMRLEMVYPSGDKQTDIDPNFYSIIAGLTFGNLDALLTGDIAPQAVPLVLATGKIHPVTYLKVPHHGSKNGLTKELLDTVAPQIAVISAGRKNRYGHPHAETLQMLKDVGAKVYGTYERGDVELISNGQTWFVK